MQPQSQLTRSLVTLQMLDLGELARAVRAILGEPSRPSRRRRRSRQRHPFRSAEARSFTWTLDIGHAQSK